MIECQLSKQAYFNKDVSEETKKLMLKAPMVNNGWESHFTVLDSCAAKHDRSMQINTVNNLQVVSYNKFLESKEMNNTSYLAYSVQVG